MMTQERYEVVKKWGNYIFLFHKTEVNETSRERFKKLLQKATETGEFTWQTNSETKAVEILFALGQIDVKVVEKQYVVSMNQDTKHALQSFKAQVHVTGTEKKEEKGHLETKNTEGAKEQDVMRPLETEAGRYIQPTIQNKEEEKPKDEEPKGESLFLDFLSPKEGWM